MALWNPVFPRAQEYATQTSLRKDSNMHSVLTACEAFCPTPGMPDCPLSLLKLTHYPTHLHCNLHRSEEETEAQIGQSAPSGAPSPPT